MDAAAVIAITAIICGTAATTTALIMGHNGALLAILLSFISSIATGTVFYGIGKKKGSISPPQT